MSHQSPQEIADLAAREARKAANEAATPEARFFLRQHANLLARIAGSRRRADRAAERGRPAALALAPLLEMLPV